MPPDGQSMFPESKPQLMLSVPGIRRDGTKLISNNYTSGQWCRFYLNAPRKMLGYREIKRDLNGIVRGMDVHTYDGATYVHAGEQNTLQRFTIDVRTGLTSGLIDRTPAAFVVSPDNNWQFGLVYNTATNANFLVAHAAPNIQDISDTRERLVYYSEVRLGTPLLGIVGSEVSGGICPMWPYLLRFGNDGQVAWNVPGDITNLVGVGSGSARPWGTKIVHGLPLRGTSGPAALLWHLDALTRMQFIGGTAIFNFDTITTSTAILSSSGVIEHHGIYYWATVSGWSLFNGVVKDIDNDLNKQFWLDNLNWDFRQKVFAFKIPRWNEIWWCGPLFGATECNWAVIYNYAKNFWYDTPLPTSGNGFSSAVYEQIFHYPLVASPATNADTSGTSIWQHDFGLNEISGQVPTPKAIRSYFQTQEFNTVDPGQPGQLGKNQTMSFSLVEPDFDQKGNLDLYLLSRANARSTTRRYGPVTIPAVPNGNEQTSKVKFTGRLTSFVVLSNVIDGNYQGGDTLFHWQPGDKRVEDGGDEPTVLLDEAPVFDDTPA